MQIVYKAKDITEAHIVANLLKENGIHAHVGGHYLQGGLGEIGVADIASVQVNDADFLQARIIVSEYDSSSSHIESASESSQRLKNTLYVLAGFILLTITLIALFNFN